jgi:hypothetical protein
MRLTEKQALQYLKDEHGIEISGATYRRDKLSLKQMTRERLSYIAAIGFEDQHIEAIDEIENGIMLMWREFMKETEPLKRTQILDKIINLRPLLSSYYDSTKGVIQKPESKETTVSIPEEQQPTADQWV